MIEVNSDISVFNRLFLEYKSKYIRFAYSYTRDWAAAEDFVVEAFLYYWENRASVAADSNLPAYILTIVKHKCLNYLEHVEVRRDAAGKIREMAEWELKTRIATLEACEPEKLFDAEVREIVSKALDTLPERSRSCFVMSRYDNKSYKEIAAQLNVSIKTVEFHIAKALKLLRLRLRNYGR